MVTNRFNLKLRKTIWNLEEKDHTGNVNGAGEEPELVAENKRRAVVVAKNASSKRMRDADPEKRTKSGTRNLFFTD